ncbi:flavin reductase family protein [soil metagenome]
MTGSSSFDDLMGRIDHPMIIVTTVAGGERAGCLVGFHAQCSIEPGRYAIWLSKANHTHRVGLLAEWYAVHFPTSRDHDLARLFGTETGDRVDKFARCRWHEGPGGVPLLDDCPNRVVGRRVAAFDDGSDHVCFVVEPTETTFREPLDLLGLADVSDLEAGHDVEARPVPPTERAAGSQPSSDE